MSDAQCCVCGESRPDGTVEFGAFRSSGEIGISMCGVCWEAAQWHDENTSDSRCVSCGQESGKEYELVRPGAREPEAIVAFCSDCRVPFEGMHRTDTGFRARANVSSDWTMQRRLAIDRDNAECQSCGLSGARLHVHHKIPKEDGGTDALENLLTLCPECHASRHGAEACSLCGSIVHQNGGATWTDDSGGAYCVFCEQCREYIKRSGADGDRCAVCARFKGADAKSDGIGFFADYPDSAAVYPACDQCRREIVFSAWDRRQQYLDNQLPDSHVNVRHWEVSADD